MTHVYRMDDRPDAASKAAIRCTVDEARAWNTPERGFGIFATVNDFGDGPRRKEHLRSIRAWAVDIDDGSKAEQHRRLTGSPLIPSMIVETKRGFQAYWCAADAKAAHWNAIVLERLVPYFGADRNARDLCRILRVPGFLHLKDPADPFRITLSWKTQVAYTERQIAEAFRWVPNVAHHVSEAKRDAAGALEPHQTQHNDQGGEFWHGVAALDCRDALERLSGTGWVNGERFTFRRVSSGAANIFCDGRGTSCWVDLSGKIGSLDKGGPLITNWLRWYGNDWRTTIEAVKTIYPHLAEADARDKARWVEAQRAERKKARAA